MKKVRFILGVSLLVSLLLLSSVSVCLGSGPFIELSEATSYEVYEGSAGFEDGKFVIVSKDSAWDRGFVAIQDGVKLGQELMVELDIQSVAVTSINDMPEMRFTLYLVPEPVGPTGNWWETERQRVGGPNYTGEYLAAFLEINQTANVVSLQLLHKAKDQEFRGSVLFRQDFPFTGAFPGYLRLVIDAYSFNMLYSDRVDVTRDHRSSIMDWEEVFLVLEVQNVDDNRGGITLDSLRAMSY